MKIILGATTVFFGIVEGADKITILLEKWHNLYQTKEFSYNYFRVTA